MNGQLVKTVKYLVVSNGGLCVYDICPSSSSVSSTSSSQASSSSGGSSACGDDCEHCTGDTPHDFTVTISGLTCTDLNGTHAYSQYDTPCTFKRTVGGDFLNTLEISAGTITVSITDGTNYASFSGPLTSCTDSHVLPMTGCGGTCCPNNGATATVVPTPCGGS